MTDTQTIPETDLTQCENLTAKGRRCKLAAGHEPADTRDGHVYVLRSKFAEPKHITEVTPDGFSLTMERIPSDADLGVERTRQPKPRDEHQVRVDKDASKAYNAWVKAGSPSGDFADLAKKYGGRYVFPPEAFDTVVAMLRRATQTGGPLMGKRLTYRRKAHESGNAMLYFLITDKAVTDDTPNK